MDHLLYALGNRVHKIILKYLHYLLNYLLMAEKMHDSFCDLNRISVQWHGV